MTDTNRWNAGNWMLLIVVATVLGANVYWWSLLKAHTPAGQSRRAEVSLIGQEAQPIVARSSSTGDWQRLEFPASSQDSIVYVVSPTCIWCARNNANVIALASAIEGRYRIIGLFLGSGDPKKYASEHRLTFPFYSEIASDARAAYRLGGTPQTIVISGGKIAANWVGAYGENRGYEIATFFGFKLPGLLADGPTPQDEAPAHCSVPDGGTYSPGAVRIAETGRVRCDKSGKWEPAE